jgi:hypothetical protein
MDLADGDRRHAREIVRKLYRDRRLSQKDRDALMKMARKVGRGASRSATPRMLRRR